MISNEQNRHISLVEEAKKRRGEETRKANKAEAYQLNPIQFID